MIKKSILSMVVIGLLGVNVVHAASFTSEETKTQTVIEDRNDKLEILKRAYFNSKMMLPEDKILHKELRAIEEHKKNFLYPDNIENNSEFRDIFETYNNLLKSNRMIDFDDILYYSYRILIESPSVAKNYTRLFKYILIDEAQDLNNTQYRIIKALTPNFKNLMMVGDSAQSIYGFNGSDSRIMTDMFIKDYQPKVFSLIENFRSTSKIIKAASKIQPESKSLSVYPLEGEFQIQAFKNEVEDFKWMNPTDIELDITSNPRLYTFWFKEALPLVMRFLHQD